MSSTAAPTSGGDPDQRPRIAVQQGRDGDVDAEADEERPGQPGQVLHGDRQQQRPQRPAVRGWRSSPSSRRDRAETGGRELVGVLGGDAAPVLEALGGRPVRATTARSSPSAFLGEQVAVGGHLGQHSLCRPTATMRPRPAVRPGRRAAPWTVGDDQRGRLRQSRSAASTSASVCTSRADSGSSSTSTDGGRGRRGPAPAAAAGRRTATGPARRCAWPAPRRSARSPPAPPAAPRPRRRRRRRAGRG